MDSWCVCMCGSAVPHLFSCIFAAGRLNGVDTCTTVLGHFVSPAEKVPLNLIELILAQGSMHTARVSPPFLMTTEA
jgi:hypothetical protein